MKTPLKLIVIFCLIILYSNICFSQNSSKFQHKFVIILDVQREYTENSMSENSAQKLIDSVNYVIGLMAERCVYESLIGGKNLAIVCM